MMAGNACVAFLIFDNRNGESLAYLLVCGLSVTSWKRDALVCATGDLVELMQVLQTA